MKVVDINGKERDAKKVELDPDFPGYVKVHFDNKVRQHDEWYTVDEFVEFNPKLKRMVSGARDIPEDITGIVTDAGRNYFEDNKAEWENNEYVGMKVWISRGKGEGQTSVVEANTGDTIYIKGEWKLVPDKSSQYMVAQYLGETKAMGNVLPQEDIRELEKRALEKDRKKRVVFEMPDN